MQNTLRLGPIFLNGKKTFSTKSLDITIHKYNVL